MNKALSAISPIDGRYLKQTEVLQSYFSEQALFYYRVKVEIEYLIAFANEIGKAFSSSESLQLRNIYLQFNEESALRIKEIEKTTNHDVKAVEYFIKEEVEKAGIQFNYEWIHFGLTSQDINNTAIPLSYKEAWETVLAPAFVKLIDSLKQQAKEWLEIPMLARTHGQAASPTTLGREWMVFVNRLEGQLNLLAQIPFSAKFGGATGGFNAHAVAFPIIDWHSFGNAFVEHTIGLKRTAFTTQIEPYDNLAAFCQGIERLNNILIDFSRDVWHYISINYFKQKLKEGEIGSSAMPHKVNPIDFENAEGNLGMANAMFHFFASKLPISRLQRDLTDSTVLRNLGVPFAHTLISLNSLQKGLSKLLLNNAALANDLNENLWVLAEGIQTILRREGYPKPYEALKALTRGNDTLSEENLKDFIQNLAVSNEVKQELLSLHTHTYIGQTPK